VTVGTYLSQPEPGLLAERQEVQQQLDIAARPELVRQLDIAAGPTSLCPPATASTQNPSAFLVEHLLRPVSARSADSPAGRKPRRFLPDEAG
jgi:hypothetical protein